MRSFDRWKMLTFCVRKQQYLLTEPALLQRESRESYWTTDKTGERAKESARARNRRQELDRIETFQLSAKPYLHDDAAALRSFLPFSSPPFFLVLAVFYFV